MEDIMTMHDLAAGAQASATTDKSQPTHAPSAASSSSAADHPPASDPPLLAHQQHPNLPQRTQSLNSHHSHLRHARSASIATSSPRTRNRLSLSFPVLPPSHAPAPRHYSPNTPSPVHSPLPNTSNPTPEDSSAFLTALAAQERRVLELREELGKAESELGRLKKQWAIHEATRKRHELTLNTAVLRGDGGATRERLTSPITREDQQLRRLATASNSGASNRKVLPSQRHQRTLSLLSPTRLQQPQPFPHPGDVDTPAESVQNKQTPPLAKRHTVGAPIQSSSSQSTSEPTTATQDQSLFEFPSKRNSQDVLLRTSKQFAEDFKDGLWTFLEDLKQATVGDDIPRTTAAPTSSSQSVRRVSSRASIRSNASVGKASGPTMQRSLSKDSVSRENIKGPKKKQKEEESLIDFGDDKASSENERDPSFRWSTSTTLSDIPTGASTPPSRASTPRTSTSSSTSIPYVFKPEPERPVVQDTPESPLWDTMVNSTSAAFTQLRLNKTASALMSHVEKNFINPLDPRAGGSTGYRGHEQLGELRSRSGSPIKAESGKTD